MKLDLEQVSRLAYLSLTESEKARFEKQLEEILNFVDQLQQVPMTAEETKKMGQFHVQTAFYESLKLDPLEKLRPDSEQSEELQSLVLTNEEATQNAPKASGLPNELLYEVPSIMEN